MYSAHSRDSTDIVKLKSKGKKKESDMTERLTLLLLLRKSSKRSEYSHLGEFIGFQPQEREWLQRSTILC